MKTRIAIQSAVLTVAMFVFSLASRAGDITRCDKVFEEVRTAVEADPPKVLVIVEDAMVANETCACEIVKAAILGSKANLDLTKQIVRTATHIAPKMAPLIAECAGAILPGGGVVETLNREVGIQPEGVQPPGGEGDPGGDDYSLMPGDIRGVYLIQPSTAGVSISIPPEEEKSGGSTTVVVRRILPRQSTPQSPSVAQGP